MTDEDMYEEYEVEDITPKGPDKEEYPLPEIIQDWIDTGSNYSKHNTFPLTMCYFNIMGQVVKDFIQIPQGSNRKDSRLHFIWLQTARTGKSAVWSFMNATLTGVYDKINAIRLDDNHIAFEEQLKKNDIFDISVYTSAALIGTFVENDTGSTKFDPEIDEGVPMVRLEQIETINQLEVTTYTRMVYDVNNEAHNQPTSKKYINEKKAFIPGALKGSGIAHWDEFESSGIFNAKKHNEDMLLTFQTFMNDIDEVSEGHIMTKYLAGVAQIGKCDSQRSLYATSYVPQNLASVISNSGVLQRAFVYVREVPTHIRRQMHKYVVESIGTEVDSTIEVEKFVEHFVDIYVKIAKKWRENGQKPTKIIDIPKEVNDVIENYRIKMEKETATCRPEIITSVESFSINLILYQVKIAMFIALSRGRENITSDDAHCAGRIVQNAYNELVGWLEQGIRIQRQTLTNTIGITQFKQAYFDMAKDENGFVHKKKYLLAVAKLLQLGPRQTTTRYDTIKEDNFEETTNERRQKWTKYIGE